MPRKLNMEVGDVFGDLKVLRIWRPPEASSKTQCDAECLRCGSVKSYYASNLISGKTTSCGCKAVGKITKPCVICVSLSLSPRIRCRTPTRAVTVMAALLTPVVTAEIA